LDFRKNVVGGTTAAVNINAFKNDPFIKFSFIFSRKTPWDREQVEKFYLRVIKK